MFNSLQALQAFGLGQQVSAQRRQLQEQEREADRARQLREGLVSAYDINTGRLDTQRARQAYVGAGDVQGAMQIDQQQATAQRQALEANRENVGFVARLAAGARDQASWDQVRSTLGRYGLDTSALPEQFDPAIPAQLQQEAAAFAKEPEQTPFMREAAAAGIRPGTPEFVNAFRNKNDPLRMVAVAAGGEVQPYRSSDFSGAPPAVGAPPAQAPSTQPTPAEINAQADAAIAAGKDPALVNARRQQLLGQGGAGQAAPRTFP
jgi:hypothetical protein